MFKEVVDLVKYGLVIIFSVDYSSYAVRESLLVIIENQYRKNLLVIDSNDLLLSKFVNSLKENPGAYVYILCEDSFCDFSMDMKDPVQKKDHLFLIEKKNDKGTV